MKTNTKKILKTALVVAAVAILYFGIYYAMITPNMLSRSWQSLIIKMCFNVILAASLSLIVGSLGELSIGHAGFFAIGAYCGCIVAKAVNLPIAGKFIVGVIVGAISAAIVGFLISSAILKLRGDYLAIVTLAFGEIIRSFVKIIPGFGGTKGLQDVPAFSSRPSAFLFAFGAVIIVILLIHNFNKSRHGRAIMAIRDNAIAAASVGINVKRYKVLTFVVAAFFAGVAGVVFGFFKTTVEPKDFTFNVSIEILVMVVLGGMSLFGSAIAACIITALPELLRDADKYRLLIYALALIFMMLAKSNPTIMAFAQKISPKNIILKFKKNRTASLKGGGIN